MKNNRTFSRPFSFLLCAIAYLLAGLAAWTSFLYLFSDWGPIWGLLAADVVGTIVIFGFSTAFQNTSFYDAYWSIVPSVILIYWWSIVDFEASNLRIILLLTVVNLWGLRLTINWIRGWTGIDHEDWRYTMFRAKMGKLFPLVNFAGLHMFSTLIVFLGCVPMYFVTQHLAVPVNALDFVALGVGLTGIAFEFLGDEQMRKFRQSNTNPEAFLKSGLWKHSRHPNYFGEVCFWLSLAIFAIAGDWANYWTLAGAIAMFAMFWFASIPMMDKRMVEKRPEYSSYMKRASRIIPWFVKEEKN